MGYPPNTKHWQPGDLVIHSGDWKGDGRMLMRVIGYTKGGLVITRYLNPNRYSNMEGECWNTLAALLDPADFNIPIPGKGRISR